jgi:hypothetical protein
LKQARDCRGSLKVQHIVGSLNSASCQLAISAASRLEARSDSLANSMCCINIYNTPPSL